MRPILFKIGPIPIYSYGLMIAIGFLVTLYFVKRDARKAGYDPGLFDSAALYVLIIGVVGTRLAHIIMFPEHYSWTDPIGWIAVWRGGLVFQGGPPLVLLFLYFYFRHHGISFWKVCDLVFPYAGLGHGIGRLGCFIRGCCYGLPTDMPWGIRYPKGSPAYEDHIHRFSEVTLLDELSLPIHPTQLYSAAGLFALCGILLLLRKYWHPFPGFTMPVYFVLYGILRFIVEEFRGDHNPVHLFNLTDQQIFSVVFALLGVGLYFVLKKRSETAAPQES